MATIEELSEENPEALLLDGFEQAFIGISRRCSKPSLATYSRDKCIEILVNRDGMTWEAAEDFFSFNIEGAWVGENAPIILDNDDNYLPHKSKIDYN